MLCDMDAIYDLETLDILLAQYEDYHTPADLVSVLPKLMGRPLALEVVLVATDTLAECVVAAFSSRTTFFPTGSQGQSSELLRRLATAPLLPCVAEVFDREMHHEFAICRALIEDALAALDVLSGMSFSSHSRQSSVVEDDYDDDTPAFLRPRQTQGQKKRALRAAANANKIASDRQLFERLNLPYPASTVEAEDVINKITEIVGSLVEFILGQLRSPDSVAALKAAYITPVPSPVDSTRSSILEAASGAKPVKDPTIAPADEGFVTPARAALYFENIKNFGPWRLHISSRAQRDLRSLWKKNRHVFKIVMKKMKELSGGHFSDDNHKKLTGQDVGVDIFEAKMTRDTRLVYRVDCDSEGEREYETQSLIVYGIYTHAQLERDTIWKSAGAHLGKRGPEYRRRCNARNPVTKGDNVFSPMSFPAMPMQTQDVVEDTGIEIPEKDRDELHELLVLEKFVPLSQALLNSILANVDTTHPFNLSRYERTIVDHPDSCYVLGRSGTGKTTTMLYKMLSNERAWRTQQNKMRKPRQLFVTQSRVLAGKVEDTFRKYFDSLEVSERKPKELQGHDQSTASWKNDVARREDLLDADDDDEYGSNLPTRFSELQDEHFPLFTTFDQLCRLLEADIDVKSELSTLTAGSTGRSAGRRRSMVTYEIFRSRYWPHFPEHLTKGLDPALVYSEIMGVIKGSEESRSFADGCLDQRTYESFSSRRQSTFASHRETVYKIFSAYTQLKREYQHIDAADRTHAILTSLQDDIRVIGGRINYLFVDEAQDNLLIDALLLRTICYNARGLFWAGDTAQTISVGSSFRFDDLKAFLHRVEAMHAPTSDVGASNNAPALFQLTYNYRSHGGIISCARTVISLISQFWPNSIDQLAEERGDVEGEKPVFFAGWDESNVRYEQFLFGKGKHEIEFGARQCIIVRTEEAQAKLRAEVGDIGLIMTVYESKGLEFDDVLLYNFFEDSTVTLNQWRVVLNSLEEDSGLLSNEAYQSAPRFDSRRHAGVCAELKSLYVAITRARKHMWIVDRSDKGEPMRMVWTRQNLVKNCSPDTNVPHLAVSSTKEDWKEQGGLLFKAKRYLQAQHCFERAELPHKAAVAHAYFLRVNAKAKPETANKHAQHERSEAFLASAHAFDHCSRNTGSDSNARERSGYCRLAGECYVDAGKSFSTLAAECFERAAELAEHRGEQQDLFIRAAKHYRIAADFDNAVRIVQHNDLTDNQDGERIIIAAKLFYFGRDEIQKGCLLFTEPFEAVEYLEIRGLDVAQTRVLEYMGRWSEAAEVHLQEGRVLKAAETYLKDDTLEAVATARSVIMRAVWEQIALGRDPRRGDQDVDRIDALIHNLTRRSLDQGAADEFTFFDILVRKDQARLKRFAEEIRTKHLTDNNRDSSSLLLSLHVLFQQKRPSGISTEQLITRLEMMLIYVRLLRHYLCETKPCRNPSIQKLFGFRPYGERRFTVLPGTYLYGRLPQLKRLSQDNDDAGIMEHDLETAFKAGLLHLLEDQVDRLEKLLGETRALDEPCLQLFIHGVCRDTSCMREHIAAREFSATHYNLRVHVNLLALMVLGTVDGFILRTNIVKQERQWSNKLYEALRPSTRRLGDPSLLDLSSPFFSGTRGLDALHAWVRPQLYSLKQVHWFHLTSTLQCAWMCATYNKDITEAANILYNAPLLVKDKYAVRISGAVDAPLVLNCALAPVLAPPGGSCFLDGVEFLEYILDPLVDVKDRVAVDMAVLCDTFEDLVASLTISWHLGSSTESNIGRRGQAPISTPRRYITLPRNWCLSAMRHRFSKRDKSARHLGLLVNAGKNFVIQLLNPNKSALYRGKLKGPERNIVVDLIIHRVCYALCLLGYNFQEFGGLRSQIHSICNLLPKWSGAPYESYAFAQDWTDLASVVQHSLDGATLDCLIRTASRGFYKNHSLPQTPNVTNILFTSLRNLEAQLREVVPGQPPKPAPAQSQNSRQSHNQYAVLGDTGTTEDGAADGEMDSVTSASQDVAEDESHDDDDDDEPEDDSPVEVVKDDTPERHAAARVVQLWYRQKHSRNNSFNKSETSYIYFTACLAAVKTLPIPSGYYRTLFLGPLPFILACLQTAETRILVLKADVKKLWKTSNPDTLEQLDGKLTAIGTAHKKLKNWRGMLKPDSRFHLERNIGILKKHVGDAAEFIEEMQRSFPREFNIQDMSADLATAVRGIVTPPAPPKRVELPTLNTADDNSYYT